MGFFHNLRLKSALHKLDKQQGGIPEVKAILASPKAFKEFVNKPPQFLTNSAEFQAFLADPNGKIGDGTLLKLFLDNLPALISALMAILALFPKHVMEAFDRPTVLKVIGEVVPNFAKIAADAMAGTSVVDLIEKYGEEEIALAEEVIRQLIAK